MDSLIEKLLADFHDRALPELTPRQQKLPTLSGKIDTVIGMRRCGKTYFLYQQMKKLLDQGKSKKSLLYINFDDDRLRLMTLKDLGRVTDVYYRLYPDLKEQRCYFFFDEMQNIDGWELYARRLLDTENAQIVLTGSSAKLLSREIASTLRGRSISTEIFPFSFGEFLTHHSIDVPLKGPYSSRLRSRLSNKLRVYFETGGFPEVQGLDSHLRLQILQEYVDLVILRDIIERHSISNFFPLRILIGKLLSEPSTLFSVNKFYRDLKSQGISCTKNTLYEHLEQIVDAYLVFPITVHSRSERSRRVNPRKVYPIDTGLAAAYRASRSVDMGRQLEGFVFTHLRRDRIKIEYYRTRNGHEVDFITSCTGEETALYQVALTLSDSETRAREVDALCEAMDEVGIDRGTIITMDEQETIETPQGIIDVVPAWGWAVIRRNPIG